jgi:BirA family transcriptional regulator, biotin operon repressor / biotin---[acetyl-CoA-carboxylase] ligase
VLTEDSLLRAVGAAGIEVPPRFADVTGSTNADGLALAEGGAPEWTVIGAGHQTEGRGRRGRSWSSAPGKALLFSVVLRPASPADRIPVMSLLAAERMARSCHQLSGLEVGCKWPNDVVVGDRKLAGVLPQASVADGRVRHVVIGIGVNVAMEEPDFPGDVGVTATSLAREGAEVDPGALLERFLAGFREAYPPANHARALEEYRRRCITLGRRIRATASGGEVVEGRAARVDDRGGLVVETADGARTLSFGEVVHLR